MQPAQAILRIELHGEEADDGRILFRSPDLEGFYFVANPDEDPCAAMEPTLIQFLSLYLNAEVRKIQPAQTPRQFRRERLGILPAPTPSRDYAVFAEVAA